MNIISTIKKIEIFKKIIENININVERNIELSVITYEQYLEFIDKTNTVLELLENIEKQNSCCIDNLQKLNDMISQLIKIYGSDKFTDIITICFDNDYITTIKNNEYKLFLINKYFKPYNYCILNWGEYKNEKQHQLVSNIEKNKIVDDNMVVKESVNLECFDLMRTSTNFIIRVYGVKIVLHDYNNSRTILVNCLVDSNVSSIINNKYTEDLYRDIEQYYIDNNNNNTNNYIWKNYVQSISVKDLLVYNCKEIYNRFLGILYKLSEINRVSISENIDNFYNGDIFIKRSTLINLLLDDRNAQFKYLANTMFELVCTNTKILNTLPFFIKNKLKYAIDVTKNSVANLLQINNTISIEHQILLMNADNNVKERAMQKLREVKSKSEESGGKAKYYLDGLLKIPFGIYKTESIFNKVNTIKCMFKNLFDTIISVDNYNTICNIDLKLDNYEYYHIAIFLKQLNTNDSINKLFKMQIENLLPTYKRKQLLTIVKYINKNGINNTNNLNNLNNLNKDSINTIIKNYINTTTQFNGLISNTILLHDKQIKDISNIISNIDNINAINLDINNYLKMINNNLEKSVFGHKQAKSYIEKILAQWITGRQTGVYFGFEGPPGVGKTSLAKYGISQCLVDENGVNRPFNFIAIGGSNNGSIIDGHSYTYLGSTWGKIVDILMTSKCMNPIIFIDEIDKVSKTENGKEIISILTHLTDSTQNKHFQDKYFSNIDLDLSRAIFIFSYNDVDAIDKILLDRIHRIKFESLTILEKIVIGRDYILPEICKDCGLTNCVSISDDIFKYIINSYTNESGVRKLKEILYCVISSINLDIIKSNKYNTIPIVLSIEDVKSILFDYYTINHVKIADTPRIGVINGMWANKLGNSGILWIETSFFATSTFLELKLTGMQGDVMRESMNVAKTLAWSMIDISNQQILIKQFESNKLQGIHIHVPEGATPKDGPSAGMAITLAIYSLLSSQKIMNTYAFTGEISLQGNITEIGGLDLKIMGAIRAGVTNIVYPKSNNRDYNKFITKYSSILDIIKYINFIEVENIGEVVKLLF